MCIGKTDDCVRPASITPGPRCLVPSHLVPVTLDMKIDRDYARETLARLVQINSINPTLAPGAPGESEIAAFIAGWLRGAGLDAEIFEPEPGRTTVLGRLRGTGGGRTLMLNAHCDAVDVTGM